MKVVARICFLGAWMFTAVSVFAGVGSPRVEAEIAGPFPMSIYSTPDGTGRAFAEAFLFAGGGYGDARITLQIFDGTDHPIASFPAEDIWLAGSAGGPATCGFRASPDHDTDAEGRTIWTYPLRAGGRIDPDDGQYVVVTVNGDAHDVLPHLLRFNSSDIDGDGRVNLTDVGLFNADLGGTAYRSDFNWDSIVNVSDAGMMAAALGTTCP